MQEILENTGFLGTSHVGSMSLHISFSDIIVKFVNHITLPYAEAPVHPVLHFFAFLSEGNRKIALVKRKYPVEKIQELFPVNRKC